MKAVVIDRYGGNEVVAVREMPRPQPGPDEVLIRVRAAAVNPLDWKIRNGMARIVTGRKFPRILGSECAGEVAATGSAVQRFRQGDRVIGYPGIRRLAAFAEYSHVREKNTFAQPQNLSFEEAATLPIAGTTALQALRDMGRLTAGHQVLINGSAGGVGTFAVQIASILGARVTAVCSGANANLARELGAELVIDYTREDFTRGSERYEIIFDAVAKSSFAACKPVLAPRGIYITTLPTAAVLLNQYLAGLVTRRKAKLIMARPNARDMEWLKRQTEAGRLRVVIDRVYSLEEVREAFAYSETGRARGKIVLRVGRG